MCFQSDYKTTSLCPTSQVILVSLVKDTPVSADFKVLFVVAILLINWVLTTSNNIILMTRHFSADNILCCKFLKIERWLDTSNEVQSMGHLYGCLLRKSPCAIFLKKKLFCMRFIVGDVWMYSTVWRVMI